MTCDLKNRMLALFLTFSLSSRLYRESEHVTVLTTKNWKKTVGSMKPNDVWVVAFYSDRCPHCVWAAPDFVHAANYSHDFIHYGSVDVKTETQLQFDNFIRSLPTFMIYTQNDHVMYRGGRQWNNIVEGAADYLTGCYNEDVDETWFSSGENAIVLFTEAQRVPFIYKKLSCNPPKGVKIGHSGNVQLRIKNGATLAPAVFLINKTNKIYFRSIEAALNSTESFFAGKYKAPVKETPIYLPSEFRSECKSPAKLCVISNKAEISKELKEAALKLHDKPIKFFQGDEDWPWSTIRKGETWIVREDISSGIRVEKESELHIKLVEILADIAGQNWVQL